VSRLFPVESHIGLGSGANIYDTSMMQANMEVDMRKLIAGMKVSVDEKIEGPEGYADWVEG
jgi:hypothetical protein